MCVTETIANERQLTFCLLHIVHSLCWNAWSKENSKSQVHYNFNFNFNSNIYFHKRHNCNAKEPLYILLKLARQLAHTYQLGMFPTVCLLHVHTSNSKIATLYQRPLSKMFVAAYVADFTQRGGPVHRKAAWERLMTSLYSNLSPHTTHIDHI